jgi:hypothetical protein
MGLHSVAQIVKLEPGDILVIGNYGSQSEAHAESEAELAKGIRELLGVSCIVVFEGDVDLSSLPAGWTPDAPAVALP